MERIIITFDKDGKFRGASVTGFNDQPLPIDAKALGKLAPEINAAAINRIIEMEAEHKEALAAKDESMADAVAGKQAEIDAHLATISAHAAIIAAKDLEIAKLQPGYVEPEPPTVSSRVKDAVLSALTDEEKKSCAGEIAAMKAWMEIDTLVEAEIAKTKEQSVKDIEAKEP